MGIWKTLVFYNDILRLQDLEAKNVKLTGKKNRIKAKQRKVIAKYEKLNNEMKIKHSEFHINPDEKIR